MSLMRATPTPPYEARPSLVQIRRQAIARLIARHQANPAERPTLLMHIRMGQQRLRLLRRSINTADPLVWVDDWNPPRD